MLFNWMDGISYPINDPLIRLQLASSSSFFGEPMYYHNENQKAPNSKLTITAQEHLESMLGEKLEADMRHLNPTEMMEVAIDKALKYNAAGTLKFAGYLRKTLNFRKTPQVIMVRAAHQPELKGTGLINSYFSNIISRADEPAVQLDYQINTFGKRPIPNSLKRAWAKKLASFDEYQLAKYRLSGQRPNTIDVIRLCHPKRTTAVNLLINDKLRTTDLTWESIISQKGSNTASWEEALKVMPHMALLRNIRNLVENGINVSEFRDKLIDGVEKGKQFPFRYVVANDILQNSAIPSKDRTELKNIFEECIKISFRNVPQFSGRVASLSDNSGSARGTAKSKNAYGKICDTGNLMGLITALNSDDGHVFVFGDHLKDAKIDKANSIFTNYNKIDKIGHGIGGGTEAGVFQFFKEAIENKEHWDHIFIYSDMQAGHGELYGISVPKKYVWSPKGGVYIDISKMINDYRTIVNPDVMIYLVQIAGYQDTLLPEYYDKTFILGGWSDQILQFASFMTKMYQPVGV